MNEQQLQERLVRLADQLPAPSGTTVDDLRSRVRRRRTARIGLGVVPVLVGAVAVASLLDPEPRITIVDPGTDPPGQETGHEVSPEPEMPPWVGSGWRTLDDQPTRAMEGNAGRAAWLVVDEATLAESWRRFGLAGAPPAVDLATEVVLLLDTSGSSSCPEDVLGVAARDGELLVEIAVAQGACRADLRPRTQVVAVDRGLLPADPFVLRVGQHGAPHPVSVATLATPPAEPSGVTSVVLRPFRVPVGQQVEVRLDTTARAQLQHYPGASHDAGYHLERWAGRQWVATGRQLELTIGGPYTYASVVTLGHVDTTGLEPGHYRVRLRTVVLDGDRWAALEHPAGQLTVLPPDPALPDPALPE